MRKIPYRIWIGVMIFLTTALNYSYRVYFQLSFIAILDRNLTRDGKTVIPPDYGPRFEYNNWQEGLIIGGYFYGQTLSSLPAGPITEYFGPWISVLISCLVSALLTVVAIFATGTSWVPLFVCRLFVGIFSGIQYPALQCLIGRWSPPLEKGKFTACLMGNVFGSIGATIVTGAIIPWLGWKSSFYLMALITVVFAVLWFFIISDYPTTSWWCSTEESTFIMESHGGAIEGRKVFPPFRKIFTSIPFLTLVVSQYGSLWGLNLVVTAMPKFMAEVLEFDLKKVGLLAALPNLARLIMGFVFGAVADCLQSRKIVTNKTIVRKGFITFSHLLPGLTLLCFTLIGVNAALAVSFLVIMLGLNGAVVATMLVNPQDLAPNFAGTLFGIMNLLGTTTGFIIPIINSKILEKNSGWHEWTIIFCIGGCLYIISGVLFIILGSTKLQPWNEKAPVEEPAAK